MFDNFPFLYGDKVHSITNGVPTLRRNGRLHTLKKEFAIRACEAPYHFLGSDSELAALTRLVPGTFRLGDKIPDYPETNMGDVFAACLGQIPSTDFVCLGIMREVVYRTPETQKDVVAIAYLIMSKLELYDEAAMSFVATRYMRSTGGNDVSLSTYIAEKDIKILPTKDVPIEFSYYADIIIKEEPEFDLLVDILFNHFRPTTDEIFRIANVILLQIPSCLLEHFFITLCFLREIMTRDNYNKMLTSFYQHLPRTTGTKGAMKILKNFLFGAPYSLKAGKKNKDITMFRTIHKEFRNSRNPFTGQLDVAKDILYPQ